MSEPDVSSREQRSSIYRQHVSHHRAAIADHSRRGEFNAEYRHHAAVPAHETLTDGRDDPQAESIALRLSDMAEQASYQAKQNRGG